MERVRETRPGSRSAAPTVREADSLKPIDTQDVLVTILARVVPWVATGVTVAFLGWWIAAMAHDDQDAEALTIGIIMALFSVYAWAVRKCLNDAVGGGPKRPDIEP